MAALIFEGEHLLIKGRCTTLLKQIEFGVGFLFTVQHPVPFESISTSQMELSSLGRTGEGMGNMALTFKPIILVKLHLGSQIIEI